ncbi:MAG: methyltransferase domain-containing protein [Stappiaceae bacterium]
MSNYPEFEKREWAGWQERATNYDATTLKMTGTTIPRLVERTDIRANQKVLDVCCGTGAVTRHLVAAGACVEGVDFSAAMIEQSERNIPDARFSVADAQNLPFENAVFDAVLTNFGHYHLPDPEQAIKEAARVLKPGGRYGFTTWVGPEESEGFRLIFETILGNLDPEIVLPPAPDPFHLADEVNSAHILSTAGCENIAVETFQSEITCEPDAFVPFLKAATVRATLVLKAQPLTVQRRIEALLREKIEQFVRDGMVCLPLPNRIITATRSGD